MNIIVIGAGYVGLTAACCLSEEGHLVTCVEIEPSKLKQIQQGRIPFFENDLIQLLNKGLSSGSMRIASKIPNPLLADIVLVAVGTPSLNNGATDLSNINAAVCEIANFAQDPLLLIMKSTVPPGTGNKLIERYLKGTRITYISNPEFLQEGKAVNDWISPSRIIIGAKNKQATDMALSMYDNIKVPLILTDITTAEVIKYAANAFLVTKISFINEIANFCDTVNANIDDVVKGIGSDPRIGTEFLRAGLGFGGSCFPKDVRALDYSGINSGYDFRLLKATLEVNMRQRATAVHKLKKQLNVLHGKDIAVLGLAFKPETDDIREAPSIDIVNRLCDEGARVRVYDPAAMANAKALLQPAVIYAEDMYKATFGSNAIILVTEWNEFIQADWQLIKRNMEAPYLVFDGRNALDMINLRKLGFNYIGIGRVHQED